MGRVENECELFTYFCMKDERVRVMVMQEKCFKGQKVVRANEFINLMKSLGKIVLPNFHNLLSNNKFMHNPREILH